MGARLVAAVLIAVVVATLVIFYPSLNLGFPFIPPGEYNLAAFVEGEGTVAEISFDIGLPVGVE